MISYLVTLLIMFQFSAPLPANGNAILEEGLSLESKGEYEEALLIWADAFSTLDKPDPAIGREFVRLATEHKLRDYYELASIIYFWGLSAEEFEETTDLLHRELMMLKPIMTDEEFSAINTLFENKDPELYRELAHFWQRLNPTPGSEHNARMVEHWERVTYARNNFTRNVSSSYGTDDRGISYIKYGPPDRKHSGELRVTRGQTASLSTMLDPGADAQFMANIVMDIGLQPEYELWIYNRPHPQMRFNLFKLFGEHPTRGYGRVEQVEDFIPSHTFTFNSERYRMPSFQGEATPAGINLNPGMVYLWHFYEHLASFEPYFAYHFNRMAIEWESAEMHLNARESGHNPTSGVFAGQLMMQQSQISALRDQQLVQVEFSTHEKNLPIIPVQVFQYRLLDDYNQPVYATFVESNPAQPFLNDFAYNEERMDQTGTADPQQLFNHYDLTHVLQLVSEDDEVLTKQRQPTDLLIDFEADEPSRSVFVIPYIAENTTQVLSAELHNRHPESARRIESSFTHTLRGLGKLEVTQPVPLSANSEKLEVSDLILGFELQENPNPNAFLPFVVANNRAIPANEDLVVRFEVYHLHQNQEGFASFELDYEIKPVSRSFLSRSQQEDFSLTLHYETMDNRFNENLEIMTVDLEPGTYELQMIFTDLQSEQQVKRNVEFDISEP